MFIYRGVSEDVEVIVIPRALYLQLSAGPMRNNLFIIGVKGSLADGGYSTIEDLLRFDIALQEHTLLSPH